MAVQRWNVLQIIPATPGWYSVSADQSNRAVIGFWALIEDHAEDQRGRLLRQVVIGVEPEKAVSAEIEIPTIPTAIRYVYDPTHPQQTDGR